MNRTEISTLILLVAGSLALHGQIMGGMGVKAGISTANQSYRFTPIDYTIETQSMEAPAVAIFMELFPGEHLSFQLDLAYLTKGSQTTTRSVTVNHLENDQVVVNRGDLLASKFRYLALSPMVRYRFGQNRFGPYLLLGPRIDLLLKYNTDSDYPLNQQNSFILGLNGGAGVEFDIGKLGVFLEMQYQPDLSPVTNLEPLHINNNVLLFNLGIRVKSGSS